jgi:hypothetical protein
MTGIRNGHWLIRILHLEETVVSITGRNLATDNAVPYHPDFHGWCEAAFNIDGVIDTMETTTKEGFFMNALRLAPRRMVKALAAGAVLVASALPLVAATGAGANVNACSTSPASSYICLTQVGTVPATPGADGSASVFGAGWSGAGTIYFGATDAASLANTVQAVSVTTTASGVTFSASAEAVGPYVTTTITSLATTTPGFYPVTVTDATGSVTIPNAFYVEAAPTITSVSPSTLPGNASGVTVTVTGTGFVTGATGKIANASAVSLGTLAYDSPTTMTGTLSTVSKATGFYGISVTNGDGATASSSTVGVTVTGPSITSVSPTSVAIPSTTASTVTLTLTGAGFQTGAYVTTSALAGSSLGVTTVVSATSITVPLTVATTATIGQLDLTVHNPDGSTAALVGAVGVGTASATAPVITSVSTLPVLSAGGSSASAIINGSGFGPAGSSVTVAFSTAAGPDAHVVCASPTVISDSQVSCIVTVTAGALAGAHSVTILPSGGTISAAFANAVTVSGPVITASTPATVPSNFTGSLTLTGTGFTLGSATATAAGSSAGTATASVTSITGSTSVTVAISATTGLVAGQYLVINLLDGSGIHTTFAIPVVNAPVISGVVYATGTTGVGQSATTVPVTIVGSGFLPGATLAFTSSLVSGSIVAITPTAIVANITTAATAATTTFTVTNTSGGYGTGTLAVNAVTQATASPTSFLAGAKAVTLTITGAGFSSATKLTASSSLITLGTPTVVSATKITVPVTVAPVTGTYLVNWTLTVTNGDGGSSSIAMAVNPGPTVTGAYYVPTFSTNYQVVVTGTGFVSGMTATSSNTAFAVTVAQVTSATSVVLLVSTTSAATAGTNSNVTLTNADGSAVTFVLNGGPAPTPVVVLTQPHVTGVSTFVKTGMTRAITLTGLHFMKGLHITSVAGTTWKVMGVSPTAVRVQVTVTKASRVGWHRLFLTNPNGKSTSRAYQQK